MLQPLVSKHQGRIVKLMGDGVLIEFASAVNAVECAVQLQEAMEAANTGLPEGRRIVLRVGINLGDVIVEGSDLYGDGVNIAARLEVLAEPVRPRASMPTSFISWLGITSPIGAPETWRPPFDSASAPWISTRITRAPGLWSPNADASFTSGVDRRTVVCRPPKKRSQ
jgi:hypothetical protein